MLKQKVFEFDCYDYFVEGRFFKRKETRYDYHMKFEFSDENYSIVIDRSCDQTVERKDTLVSSHAEVYLQDMPVFVMEPIAFQKLSGTAFRLKGHYVDYEEHLLDTGEKIYEQKKCIEPYILPFRETSWKISSVLCSKRLYLPDKRNVKIPQFML